MTKPNDPWSQRPAEQVGGHGAEQFGGEQPTTHLDKPTERIGRSPYFTSDPHQAYGEAAPPPNATLPYPTYDYATRQQQHSGYGPGEVPPLEQAEPPGRSTGLVVGIGIGVGLLVAALIGAIFLLLDSHKGASDTSASPATAAYPETTTQQRTLVPRTPRPGAPGLGLDQLGATMGSITANDGATLAIKGLLGGSDTVHTNEQTQVVSLTGSKVADLKVGETVVVQGDKAADGSITAKVIISTSLGNFGN